MKAIMRNVRMVLAIVWFVASIAACVVVLSNRGKWSNVFASSGVRVNNRFTGGEVAVSFDRMDYTLVLHRPVFDNAFGGTTGSGFVQVDIVRRGSLPSDIREDIDYDGDGVRDFTLFIDGRTYRPRIVPFSGEVGPIMDKSSMAELVPKGYPDARNGAYVTSTGLSVRVLLKKKKPSFACGACAGCGRCIWS